MILTEQQQRQLDYAKRYYHDASGVCWTNPEVLKIVYTGGWGRAANNPEGGLMGATYNGYTFKYKGFPLWGIEFYDFENLEASIK